MSYEMLMEIVLSYLKERKGSTKAQSEQELDSESFKPSINHEAPDRI